MPQHHKPVSEQELAAAAIAPRITLEAVEANIQSEHYFTAGEGAEAGAASAGSVTPEHSEGGVVLPEALRLLTICVLVLQNGFTVQGVSACASPENFNPEIGKRLARQDAVKKIWGYMGYELRSKLHYLNQLNDTNLGEALTRMLAYSVGNGSAFRSTDADLILSYIKEEDQGSHS